MYLLILFFLAITDVIHVLTKIGSVGTCMTSVITKEIGSVSTCMTSVITKEIGWVSTCRTSVITVKK
jgi:hypothetical protein